MKIKEPLENGVCKKCKWNKGRFCKAYEFLGRLADCEFISCCERFEEE